MGFFFVNYMFGGVERKGKERKPTRRGAESQHSPRGNGRVRRRGQIPPDAHLRGRRSDDRSYRSSAPVGGEEVARAVDLSVVVVCRAGSAQAAAGG